MLPGLLLACCTSSFAVSPATITVQVTNGGSFTGEMDIRTNDRELWLRMSHGSAHIQRPLRWDAITAVIATGKSLPLGELQRQAKALGTAVPLGRELSLRSPLNIAANHNRATTVIPPRIRSIGCYATLANWDADGDLDGLLLNLTSFDATGNSIPVTGTLQVELIGVRYSNQFAPSTGSGREFVTLESWGRTFDAAQPNEKLEFVNHSLYDQSFGLYGILQVRLIVPGSGVFEQRLEGVRIRPYSFLRDVYSR